MNRREFIYSIGILALGFSFRVSAKEVSGPMLPDPKSFESGDLIWPKKPGVFVPYASTFKDTNIEKNKELWLDDRVKFINSARNGELGKTAEENLYWKKVADEVEKLDFTTFYHKYAADSSPNDYANMGGGNFLYVGHVGIIEIDTITHKPYVIEAVLDPYNGQPNDQKGIIRISYDDWLRLRGDVIVWHARLKEDSNALRPEIVSYAKRMIGKPYDFWNFDLSDERGFYCSKLVWQSVFQTAGISLDKKNNPKRIFWFSPLQALKSEYLTVVSG